MVQRPYTAYSLFFRRLPLFGIALVALLLTVVVFLELQKSRQTAEKKNFTESARRFTQGLSEAIDENLHNLLTLNAFFNASDLVTQDDFTHYTDPLLAHHPSIGTVGFLTRENRQGGSFIYHYLAGQDTVKNKQAWIGKPYTRELPEDFSLTKPDILYASRLTTGLMLSPGRYALSVIMPMVPSQNGKSLGEAKQMISITLFLDNVLREAAVHSDYRPKTVIIHDINRKGILRSIIKVSEGSQPQELREYTLPKDRAYYQTRLFIGERSWNLVIESPDSDRISLTVTDWGTIASLLSNALLLVNYFFHLQRREEQIALQVEDKTRALSRSQEHQARLISQLSDSNAELQRFAYVASHDLQEPLRVIGSFSTKIKRALDDPAVERDSLKAYAQFVHEASSQLHGLVRDLLAYARSTGAERVLEAVDLTYVVRSVCKHLHEAIQESGAQVHIETLGEVKAYKAGMMQLFQNLLINAIKYRYEGRKPVIRISAIREDGMVKICVEDNGIGIPEAEIATIFLPFKRLQYHSKTQGSGIGLAICKQVVESCGGGIYAESVIGKGSRFYVLLPKG